MLWTTLFIDWNVIAEIYPTFLHPLFPTVQGGHPLVVANTHQYHYWSELAHWSTKASLWTCASYKARMVGYRYIKWQVMCFVSCQSPQKFLYWIPSAGWRSIASFFHSLACHCNDSAFALFASNHRKWGIMGKYHATLASTVLTFLFSPMSSSSIFLLFRLYHDVPQTQHYSNMTSSLQNSMQSFWHAWIFSTFNPNGQTIFLAWYVLWDNTLAFGSKSFKNYNNSLKPLSDQPLLAFICNNVSKMCNLLCSFLHPENNGVS
jgi:hypothetical protein